jgi:methylenetetrahydrofolate--tRNA-(uracil-5-)-methyltransferase
MVGFQTRMTWPEQSRVLRTIPGLEAAEFLRFGSVHRNTFVDAPRCLDARMQLRALPNVFLAGQITGVEGYVESCACGFVCAVLLSQTLRGLDSGAAPTGDGARGGHHAPHARSRRLPAVERDVGMVATAREPSPEKARSRRNALAARALVRAHSPAWMDTAPCARAA